MSTSNKHIVIVAGEASGDMHAAHLVEAIKKVDPSITFSGLGGPKMQEQGVEIYEDLTKMAVVGFVEVLKHYGEIKKAFKLILKKIKETQADAVILVDYPGFNLRLAKKLRKKKIKVIYYISPQVWAWKENRVKLAQACIDKMLVVFEFEKEFYARHGMDVEFVGHPLLDTIKITTPKEELLKKLGLEDFKLTIGLLPGSREKEVERLLPMMIETAELLAKDFPMAQFLLVKAPSVKEEWIKPHTENLDIPLKVVEQSFYDSVNACDLCVVASGTATLETAILGKPMVVVYKTSGITFALAKSFVKIPDIGLVNVVAGKRVVPECIQHKATASNVAKELKQMFTDEVKLAEIKNELMKVKESLGTGGASDRAAKIVVDCLKS